ncbi:hypothetical protein MmiEs2_09090 [Methanimicrococcus stummii]|uniref:Uncharacterized protein n=1 Tax=Methanimicrococcus stummii TaxID=3028294 RepID=A0AA96VA46_9EURY|nr:hypothetical protein [Methanimicrococcus sp. Es2]WNY28706.1 hypothetical protein MmiEs2_09090 [Methanimicrococcus sp. Es2]
MALFNGSTNQNQKSLSQILNMNYTFDRISAIDFSTDDHTTQNQNSYQYSNQTTNNHIVAPVFALNSSGVISSPTASPKITTETASALEAKDGGTGINPAVLVLGAVAAVVAVVVLPEVLK